ncbi:MAG: penicillin-binding protein 1A [Glaciecola sp.]|jgi:penicillin-binding protein 1A
MAIAKRKTSSKKSKARRPWWRRWWMLLLTLPAILLGLVATVVFFLVFASVPLPQDIGAADATFVLDRDGNPYGQLSAQVGRVEVDIEDLPGHVPLSVLAAEDRGYYQHGGISVTSILRAAVVNLRSGEAAQGGSTITQQYVKNAVVGNDRTLVRKLKEAALAMKLERRFSKDEILELYLNTIYWGRGAYGIDAAARTYYGIPSTELSLTQSSTLAGIISSPENLDPAEEPEAAARRQRYVLDGLLTQEWIGEDTWTQAIAEGLPEVTSRTIASAGAGGYYLDAVRREVAALVGDEAIFRGLTITTEVDARMQTHAENAMAGALAGQPFSGALVAIDPVDGGIRALVGGPDPVAQPFNAAIKAVRQSGSSFKPFTLAAWIDNGWSPESAFPGGASRTVSDGKGGTTSVSNYGGRDRGSQTLRQGTWTSTNTVYLDAQTQLGADKVAAMARTLGVPENRDLPEVATLTLGVSSVTPLDMAAAYSTLASGGVHSQPRLVSKVVTADGEVLFSSQPERTAVIEANTAYLVSDVLQGVISSGTGGNASIDRPAAGKTGTTDDFRDAWFVGYTPDLVASVWVGNLDNSPMDGVTGGSVPAQVWSAFMRAALDGTPPTAFPEANLRGLEVRGDPNPDATASETATDAPSDGASEPQPDDSPSPSDAPCPPGVTGILAGCTSQEPSPSPTPTPTPTPSDPEPEPTPSSSEPEPTVSSPPV